MEDNFELNILRLLQTLVDIEHGTFYIRVF